MKNISFSLTQIFLLSAIILITSNSVFAQSNIIYVNSKAIGANNGTNWQNAFKNLQSALGASSLEWSENIFWQIKAKRELKVKEQNVCNLFKNTEG